MGMSNSTISLREVRNQAVIDVHKSAAAKIQISNILHLLIHKYELISVVVNIELMQEENQIGENKSIYTIELKEEVNYEHGTLVRRNTHSKSDTAIEHISVPILRNNYNFGTLIVKPLTLDFNLAHITTHDLVPFSDKIAETIIIHRHRLDGDLLSNINQDHFSNLSHTESSGDKQNVITLSQGLFSCLGFRFDINKEHSALAKAIPYIVKNYTKHFTMHDLAEHCCVSASHLSCLIKNRFGLSFKKILMKIRIEKAKTILLKLPSRQITNVCIDVGFSDLSHFERTFKKSVGVSPRVFRNTYKNTLSTTIPRQGLLETGILK